MQTVKGFLQADAAERIPRSARPGLLLRYSASGNVTSSPSLKQDLLEANFFFEPIAVFLLLFILLFSLSSAA